VPCEGGLSLNWKIRIAKFLFCEFWVSAAQIL
jgi:hypothetical protein